MLPKKSRQAQNPPHKTTSSQKQTDKQGVVHQTLTLFARLSSEEVVVSKATGIREGDKRGRFLFWPNRKKNKMK
jgi:hypothetical protein